MGKAAFRLLICFGCGLLAGTLSHCAIRANARDLGQWENNPPELRQWYKSLTVPDDPGFSCCGEADAYWADSFEDDGQGHYLVTITDERDDIPFARPHIEPGTKIVVPNSAIKWDQGNPTGHGVIFIAPFEDYPGHRHVFCYVPPGGV